MSSPCISNAFCPPAQKQTGKVFYSSDEEKEKSSDEGHGVGLVRWCDQVCGMREILTEIVLQPELHHSILINYSYILLSYLYNYYKS